ncbi:hypothetical protein ACWEPB_02575 [Kitasatospora cineracea]
MPKPVRTPREQLERALHVSFKLPTEAAALLDAHEQQVLAKNASTVEALRARLWLIEQALTPIDISQDPAGIVGMIGPLLDGPLHPADLADYRARTGQEG